MPWVDDVAGILHSWYLGNATGSAIADVLFGKINPCAKLSLTFPKRLEDTPSYGHFGSENGTVWYAEDLFVVSTTNRATLTSLTRSSSGLQALRQDVNSNPLPLWIWVELLYLFILRPESLGTHRSRARVLRNSDCQEYRQYCWIGNCPDLCDSVLYNQAHASCSCIARVRQGKGYPARGKRRRRGKDGQVCSKLLVHRRK